MNMLIPGISTNKCSQDPTCLNQPSFYKMFTQPGKYIVRAVVSDMRGGTASQNLEVIVDGEEYQNSSTVSGTVRSSREAYRVRGF